MKFARLVLLIAVGFAGASRSRAQSLAADFTAPGGLTSGVSDLVLGFEFQVNSTVTVTGLADFGPTVAGNQVGLWDNSQNLLAETTVSAADPTLGNGFFNYAPVASTTLSPGIYYVGAELDGLDGSLANYTWDGVGLTTIPQISDLIPAYGFGGALTFPGNPGGGATSAYFGGDVVIGAVPDGGATITLLGLALTGLSLARRPFRD